MASGAVSTFSVATGGKAPLGYQWLRNGVAIEGATGSSYTLPASQPMDSGTVLRVVVRGGDGELIESAPAMSMVSGSGMRMMAGALELLSPFSPLFDVHYEMGGIVADSAGTVFATRRADLISFTPNGTGPFSGALIGAQPCPVNGTVAMDRAGVLYIACGPSIYRKMPGATAAIRYAGSTAGNEDGAIAVARFADVTAMSVGPDGVLIVADSGNGTLRRIAANGAVTTLAGSARNGSAADGMGAAARFISMNGIAITAQGDIYVGDRSAIRKVSSAGVVSTIAGDASATAAGWVDGAGSVARFNQIFGIVLDASGHLYIADAANHNIRKMAPDGSVTTVAGRHDQFGSGDGFGKYAQFNMPRWLTMDGRGSVIVADYGNGTLRKLTPEGVVTTMAGKSGTEKSSGSIDGMGQEARLREPKGLAVDDTGNVLVADTLGHSIRTMSPAGQVSTLAGSSLRYGTVDGSATLASFRHPQLVASAGHGVVFVFDSISDITNNVIRRIGPDGVVTTVQVPRDPLNTNAAGVEAMLLHELLAADSKGNYYVQTDAFLTGACPSDPDRNACGGISRKTIRRIAPDNSAVTIISNNMIYPGTSVAMGAQHYAFRHMAVDRDGNAYFADFWNNTVIKLSTSGTLSLFAGAIGVQGSVDGPASVARLAYPEQIAVDSSGNVYVATDYSSVLRKITPAGVASTIAGTPSAYDRPTGVLPGKLSAIGGLAVSADGIVYLLQDNAVVRIVQP